MSRAGYQGLTTTARADLEIAWKEREEEAATLKNQGFLSTAAALRIYALEIRIKFEICDRLALPNLPGACKTHDLSELILFTGLWRKLQDPSLSGVRQKWDVLVKFSKERLNDQRYLPRNNLEEAKAKEIDEALDDPGYGVLPWLSNLP